MIVADTPLALPAIAALGYLLGSIPFGLLLTRAAGLGDIRAIGSGSIGATNVLRTGRKGLAAATLLLDALKGAIAVLAGLFLADTPGVVCGGLAVVLGHLYPVWLGFRGGKGVATGLGVLLVASPIAAGLALATWLIVARLFRFSSLASLCAVALAPLFVAMVHEPVGVALLTGGVAILLFVRHEANIRRLLLGTEPRIGETR